MGKSFGISTLHLADLIVPVKENSLTDMKKGNICYIILFGIIIAAVCIISYIIIRKLRNKNANR